MAQSHGPWSTVRFLARARLSSGVDLIVHRFGSKRVASLMATLAVFAVFAVPPAGADEVPSPDASGDPAPGVLADPAQAAAAPPGFQSIAPCRIVDTRVSYWYLDPGESKSYQVAGGGSGFADQGGKPGGCDIPTNATAIEATITAVDPSTDGFARTYPAGTSTPRSRWSTRMIGAALPSTFAVHPAG